MSSSAPTIRAWPTGSKRPHASRSPSSANRLRSGSRPTTRPTSPMCGVSAARRPTKFSSGTRSRTNTCIRSCRHGATECWHSCPYWSRAPAAKKSASRRPTCSTTPACTSHPKARAHRSGAYSHPTPPKSFPEGTTSWKASSKAARTTSPASTARRASRGAWSSWRRRTWNWPTTTWYMPLPRLRKATSRG